jgi:dienelactone hydrolase
MGHVSPNAQLIADQLAQNGYFVVLLDLFGGDALEPNRPADFDFQGWRAKHGLEQVGPIVDATIKEVREKYGAKKIGALGYCFGARYVVRNLKKGVLDAGYLAHPSFVESDEVRGIEGPISIAAAGKFVEQYRRWIIDGKQRRIRYFPQRNVMRLRLSCKKSRCHIR